MRGSRRERWKPASNPVNRAVAFFVLLLALAATPAVAQAHSRTGGYQNMAHEVARDYESPYPLVHGIPMVDYGSFRARNPVTTAQYGLANWTLWVLHHERDRLRRARRAADWLVATQRKTGQWLYRFAYRSPGTTMELPVPWASALAQGQAISLLRRLYFHTHRRQYLRAARRALAPLGRSVARGGLLRWRRGEIVFEEYPTERRSLPLNGHLQTLIGLYDLSDLSPTARRWFRRGVRSAAGILPDYDAGGGRSLYSLVNLSGFPPFLADDGYHSEHVEELRLLNRLSPHRAFRRYIARWSS